MVIEVAKSARISELADIEDSARGSRIIIGDDSVIDSFVKIKPAGGSADVVIGKRVTINSGCVIYSGNGLVIGDDVAVAANCVFAPVNHAFSDRNRLIRTQGFLPSKGGIRIGNDVWIGAGCVFLDGTVVGQGAVIGAMSLVRGAIPEYSVVHGSSQEPVAWRT